MQDVKERLRHIITIITNEQEVLDLGKENWPSCQTICREDPKGILLREQMKAIQKELGDRDGKSSEIEQFRADIKASDMTDHMKEVAEKELSRYERVPQSSAESSVIRNYLEWLIALPWKKQTEDNLDIPHAEETLNRVTTVWIK